MRWSRIAVACNVNEGLGPAIAVFAVVVHHRLAQREVGYLLVFTPDRRHDVQAARIGLVAEHLKDQLAGKFGGELRMQPTRPGSAANP